MGATEHPERSDVVPIHLAKIAAFDGLPEELHAKLAEIVTDLWLTGNDNRRSADTWIIQTAWAKDGEKYIHEIRQHAEYTCHVIGVLMELCDNLGVGLGEPVNAALRQALVALEVNALDDAPALLEQLREQLSAERAMLTLYDFFISSRAQGKLRWSSRKRPQRLREAEAEVRVAEIGEALFGWNVPYCKEVSQDDDRLGCEAVRKAVRRRRAAPLREARQALSEDTTDDAEPRQDSGTGLEPTSASIASPEQGLRTNPKDDGPDALGSPAQSGD
jgi:hypothetical protein